MDIKLMPVQEPTKLVAKHIAQTTYSDLPENAVAAAKRTLFDTLAVAIAGRNEAGVVQALDLMRVQGGVGESRIWGTSIRLPAMSTAFVNGIAAAALDFDSLHEGGTVHSDIVVAPAVLALAESRGATGADVLTALVLGNDIACRLGMSTREHRGWFYTSLHGVFAAAAASAKLLGLDAEGVQSALGIALSRTGGTQQPARERVLTKRMQSAFVARDGVLAALLAERGVTGPTAALEGQFGLYAMYEHGDPDVLAADLGSRFENVNLSFKAFPSCACNHAVIAATLDILKAHDISASDIDAIEATITPYMDRLVGAPFSAGSNPQIAAQFSAQYSIAAVLLHGGLGLDEIHQETVTDPQVAELVGRISLVVDHTQTGEFGPASVSILCKDGQRLEAKVDSIPGRPENPLSDAELIRKANACLPLENGEELFAALANLDRTESVDGLLDELEIVSDGDALPRIRPQNTGGGV